MTISTISTISTAATPAVTGAGVESHAIGLDAATTIAATLKALADPLRLRILSAIATSATGELSAGELATLTQVSQPTVSHHLKVLREVGLLAAERRATWVWYRVEPAYRGAVTTLLDRFAPATVDAHHVVAAPIGLTDVDDELDRLAQSLHDRVPGADLAEVLSVVRESYAALARRGGVPTHLVALTEHFARQRLTDAVRARTETPHRPPQVLFVCVANAGRSQLAAALMRHHAGDRVVVRSAGSSPAGAVHAGVRDLLAELGADTPEHPAYPKPLTDDAVRAADVVITMGCGDACPVLPGTRYEDWAVGDPALASPAGVRAIRDELDTRVRALLDQLGVPAA
jgi:ArsR family transcriptional regulator